MTKKEIEYKVKYLKIQLANYEKELERMDKVLELDDYWKTLKKYSMAEMAQLNDISPDAFNWMQENEWGSIKDYNYQMSLEGKDKVLLYDD